MAATIAALSKRLQRLEGDGGGIGSLPPGWWGDFEGFALLVDPSWRPYCRLEQFLIGRASMAACWWRSLTDCYNNLALKHREPDWWRNSAWRSKTPDWEQRIERERRLHCPPENRRSMVAFVEWLYDDNAPRTESYQPWAWCQPDVGSMYQWPDWRFHRQGLLPLAHALAIASAIWLVDDLGMKPEQVRSAASAHFCAFRWNDLSRLAQVQLPDRPITSTSPQLRIAEMTTWAKAHDLPVDEDRSRQGAGLELLELLMCVASGCGGPHGCELIFPSLEAQA
jgi:hypothetical protein